MGNRGFTLTKLRHVGIEEKTIPSCLDTSSPMIAPPVLLQSAFCALKKTDWPKLDRFRNSLRAWPSSGRVPGRAGQRTFHPLQPFWMQRKAAQWYLHQQLHWQECSNKRFTFDVRRPSRSTAFPSRATVLQFHVRGWTRSIVKRFGKRRSHNPLAPFLFCRHPVADWAPAHLGVRPKKIS